MKKLMIVVIIAVLMGLSGCSKPIVYDEDSPYYSFLSEDNPRVTIDVKGYGDIVIELFPEVAPLSVDNFIAYIEDDAYEDSTFHRVINDFMIQGGIVSDTACSITGEFDNNGYDNPLNHYPGTIAMARTSVKDSATSQFFINEVYNSYLDNDYAAFGGVISGFDIVEDISDVETFQDAPTTDIVIKSITVDLNGYSPNGRTCN